jgi:UDP-glucose 4-epimerase
MILVTGGAGYIGSHFVKFLKNHNKEILVIDNLSRGHRESIPDGVIFENVDLLDFEKLNNTIKKYPVEAVVHFAAFAYVGESVENPGLYYSNNVTGSINLIRAVNTNKIKNFVFSSTCSVYGNPENIPISENESAKPINPYAKTKLTIENVLQDFSLYHGLNYVALRYFNAAGADPDGQIGESHNPEPHLIPIVLNTALGKREKVLVFGNDYNTPDGTCIRDYIHLNDLASAHLKALNFLEANNKSEVINLGTGEGNSVLQIIQSAEKITGRKINYQIVERRPGDPDILVADNKKAKQILDWQPKFGLQEIIQTAWNWHKNQKY